MTFSDFRYPDVLPTFKLSETGVANLFANVKGIAPGPTALRTQTFGRELALTIDTEKSRSEWLIAPILGEFWD